ncbi:TonB-dependent receptor domain-containing protein [Flavobacterium sp.]|uniref:TonB-dependent receptor domain-containing protein n=1 Tax=Flavobacterium sp. TaxID=239 RepID=UPI0040349BB6
MRLKFLVITLFTCLIGFAQGTGTVTGNVTDLDANGETLPFATVSVKGTTINTSTDIDGNYTLTVPAGEHTVVFSFLGYMDKSATVKVAAGETVTLNQQLKSDSVQMDEVIIEKVMAREKETALLQVQKDAIEIKQNIGAQELSRKGIGDVATAVAKTSGISKQEGSNNVYVRGLGDRYNSTTINGLPIPSNDPEKKNIFLDIFTTDIVDYISIDKVYSTRIFGDFAGGNVDIISKEYRGDGMLEVSVGSKVNTNALNKSDKFFLQDGPGKMGFTNYDYSKDALTSYTFDNKLNPQKQSVAPYNFGFKAGDAFNIGEQGRLSLFGTANFSNGYEQREGDNRSVSAQGAPLKSFYQERFQYNTNTTGMLNAAYRINDKNKLSYNFLFVNTSDQTRDTYTGFLRDVAEDGGTVLRSTYTKNTLMINQLLGNHKIDSLTTVDWGTSFNTVTSDMPDRTQNIIKNVPGSFPVIAQNSATDNHRYFQNLKEHELAANISATRKFGQTEDGLTRGSVTAGYAGRFKKRDFEAIQFNYNHDATIRNATPIDLNNLDAFYNPTNFANGFYSITAYAGMTPQTYSGEQNIHAGYVNADYKLTEKLTASLGLRYEKVEQIVDWVTQFDTDGGTNTMDRNEFLPNLIVKYELNDKQNLRFAASKTYTLPQFKERSPFIYEDVNEIKYGNQFLYSSQDYNIDLKWEYFPKNDELISATLFGKMIVDPIAEVNVASSTNDISWVNIGDKGTAVGVEVEIKKNLFTFDSEFTNKISAGLNVAYMKTKQDIDREKVLEETNGTFNLNINDSSSAFTGASDLLLNADISYSKDWDADKGFTATLMYSQYSDRLYALGIEGKGNQVDKGMGALDMVLKTRLGRHIGIDVVGRNLLNPEFERIQENAGGHVPVVTFKRGAYIGLGVTYKL